MFPHTVQKCRLIGDFKLPVGVSVNVAACLHMLALWLTGELSRVFPRFLPNVSWEKLQPLTTGQRDKCWKRIEGGIKDMERDIDFFLMH